MRASRGTCAIVLALVAVLVTGMAEPGQAGYTKAYRFPNSTGVNQSSVTATTNGLESVVHSYAGCCARVRGWNDNGTATGYAVSGGVFCTTVTFFGPAVAPGKTVFVGWVTGDNSCRLRDLRWGGGQTILATDEGLPGGGMVFYDYPDPGCLTVVITNDTEGVIALSDVEFAILGSALDLEGLDAVLDSGLVELRVASIDEDIDVILAEIAYYDSIGELPSPSGNSLARKLERAASYKHEGLAKYLDGDLDKALFAWDKAAHQVENFISQVTAMGDNGNLPLSLYERWAVDGGGAIAPAPEIRDALLALPEGEGLQSLTPLPCGELPAYPGLDPANCVEWPVDSLNPGEFTAFVVCNMDLGAGFIMGGSVVDADGNVLLDWLEQSVAEPAVIDADPPEITGATATPDHLWPPDHSMVQVTLDVAVSDNSGYAIWYVADVTSNQPVLGTGDGDTSPDWVVDSNDPQSLWLRAERSGNDPTGVRYYTVTLMAIDMAGNLSEPYDELVVFVDHDMDDMG